MFISRDMFIKPNDWVFQIIKLQRPAGRFYYEEGAFSNFQLYKYIKISVFQDLPPFFHLTGKLVTSTFLLHNNNQMENFESGLGCFSEKKYNKIHF